MILIQDGAVVEKDGQLYVCIGGSWYKTVEDGDEWGEEYCCEECEEYFADHQQYEKYRNVIEEKDKETIR